jgi:hypothetical protein
VEACQRQVQISSAVAAAATAAAAASPSTVGSIGNGMNGIVALPEATERMLTDIHKQLHHVDTNVTLLTRDHGISIY